MQTDLQDQKLSIIQKLLLVEEPEILARVETLLASPHTLPQDVWDSIAVSEKQKSEGMYAPAKEVIQSLRLGK